MGISEMCRNSRTRGRSKSGTRTPLPHAWCRTETTKLPVGFSACHQTHRPACIHGAETVLSNRFDADEAVDAAFEQLNSSQSGQDVART